MIYIIIAIALFVVMALFPLTFSIFALSRHKSEQLIIPTLLVDDPKYFTDLYRSAFKVKLASMDEENIVEYSFKPNEKIVEADKTIEFPVECHTIIYAEHYDFIPPEGIAFHKEIYANKNVYLMGVKSVFGIYCKKNLVLGKGIDVIRWADADGQITVEDNCSLGIITTSSTRVIVGENCLFTRMLAPQIFLGFTKENDFRTVSKSLVNEDDFMHNSIVRHITRIDDDDVGDDKVFSNTVITKYDITVIDNIIVKGDIRSHKSVRIGDGAVVCGNIFAEGNIYLGQGSKVLGNVFSQENIYTEQKVTIGQKNKIKSVIAKEKIVFDKCCVVYGYIESENICEVCVEQPNKEMQNEY